MNYLRATSGLWFPEPVYNMPGMVPGPGLFTTVTSPPPSTWSFTTSHSPYAGSSSPTKANMEDDTFSTYYGADTNETSWVKADFGAQVYVTDVTYAHPDGTGGWSESHLNGSVLAWSTDDSTWTDFHTISGLNSSGGEEQTQSVGQTCRYIRCQKSSAWLAISEFNFT